MSLLTLYTYSYYGDVEISIWDRIGYCYVFFIILLVYWLRISPGIVPNIRYQGLSLTSTRGLHRMTILTRRRLCFCALRLDTLMAHTLIVKARQINNSWKCWVSYSAKYFDKFRSDWVWCSWNLIVRRIAWVTRIRFVSTANLCSISSAAFEYYSIQFCLITSKAG